MLFGNPIKGPLHPIGWVQPTTGPHRKEFRVTQKFGCTGHPAEPPFGNCPHFHRAIDLGNKRDEHDPILAANPGKVILAKFVGTNQSLAVVINHFGGWFSLYGHLDEEFVAVGQEVKRGTQIGTLGKTGADAAHLHFGIKSGMNASQNFFADDVGTWENPWRLLEDNVRIHPVLHVHGVNIRSEPVLGQPAFAQTTALGRIQRLADGVDLGAAGGRRKWGGIVDGDEYVIDGVAGRTWERINLDGQFRFIAQPLCVRSAS